MLHEGLKIILKVSEISGCQRANCTEALCLMACDAILSDNYLPSFRKEYMASNLGVENGVLAFFRNVVTVLPIYTAECRKRR
jgi:hypothetical protein